MGFNPLHFIRAKFEEIEMEPCLSFMLGFRSNVSIVWVMADNVIYGLLHVNVHANVDNKYPSKLLCPEDTR